MGWLLENEILKRVHPALVTMKANTSVCLMLVALSVFLIQDRPGSKVKRRIARACAAIVALVGLLTLSQHLIGWDLGIDQVLFYESREAGGPVVPGSYGRGGVAQLLFFGPRALACRCSFEPMVSSVEYLSAGRSDDHAPRFSLLLLRH